MNLMAYPLTKAMTRSHLLSVVYLLYLAMLTLHPFTFSMSHIDALASSNRAYVLSYFFYIGVMDVLQNVILFIPLGILIRTLAENRSVRKHRYTAFKAVITGILISFTIEFMQLFLDRSSAFFDIVANGFGTWIGYSVMSRGCKRFHRWRVRHQSRLKSGVRIAVVVYGVLFFVFSVQPLYLNRFDNWDSAYPLLVGNELTGNRPWQGELFLLAIYGRALDARAIAGLWKSGSQPETFQRRMELDPIALYGFVEGSGDTVHDISSNEPIHLFGAPVSWLNAGQGIRVKGGAGLISIGSAKKIADACRATGGLTVEVWCRSADMSQSGPARIVSVSKSTDLRNFTLGQEGRDLLFRVRTPLTGPNASFVQLWAEEFFKDCGIHHVIAVFDRGWISCYLDGRRHQDVVRAELDYLLELLVFGDTAFGRWAFCFMFLFPLSAGVYWISRKRCLVLTACTVLGIMTLVELVYYAYTGQPFDIRLFIMSSAVCCAGILFGRVWRSLGISSMNAV